MSMVEPSYKELATIVVELTVRLSESGARIEALEVEVEALRSQLGKNSKNSSVPQSREPIAAKAERKAVKSQRVRSKDRKRGGQPGRRGSGLMPTADPDDTVQIEPEECSSCGADLAEGTDEGTSWAQVWDILPVVLQKLHYVLTQRRCSCGKVTTATPPLGQAGAVVYGPAVNAAAIELGSEGNVPVEKTAGLMADLLGVPVSTGFVARAQERLAEKLTQSGFDEAMIGALRAEPILCGDETPVNVVDNVDSQGLPADGSPHVVVVRCPDERLVWYRAITARTSVEIAGLGVFDSWNGILVRDDYAGWHQFDATLSGVQQCVAHLIRHLQGVLDINADAQQWAAQVQKALRDAARLVAHAVSAGIPVNAEALTDARWRYDQGVAVGISTNMSRPWPKKGNHPGLVLARRLQRKAVQAWLFTENLDVPWTNNGSERSLKSPKLHQKVSNYWQNTNTLANFCRVRSYLVTARNHGIRVIDAIHDALAGKPWLPTPAPS